MRIYLTGSFLLIFLELFSGRCTGSPPVEATYFRDRDSVFVSNLPLISINTGRKNICDKKKITAGMGIIYNGYGKNNRATDPPNQYSGSIKIEVRGSSSKSFPKKSYSIQTIDEVDRFRYVSLLGLPSECEWVLYAPYNDKSLLRDALAYNIARDMNRYATQTKYVELILNGRYQGIYILEEKIKRSPVRVKTNTAVVNGGTKSDGFILRIDKPHDGNKVIDGRTMTRIVGKTKNILLGKKENKPNGVKKPSVCSQAREIYFRSAYPPVGSKWQVIKFSYYDPKPEEITEQNRLDICEFVHTMESSLLDPFTTGMDSGYHRYLDMESFIDFFIINEVTKNMDGYRLSTYFYKTGDKTQGTISLGPPWDFNIAMGNVDYCEGHLPTGWAYEYNGICPNDAWLVPFWWERLMEDPVFRDHLKCRWNTLRSNSLATENLVHVIDSISNSLEDAPHRNFKRWRVLGKNVWPNKYVFKSYLEELAFLKNWLTERLEWLDRNMPGNCPAIPPEDVGNKN